MKHVVAFSGGKDSTALILWAKDELPEFETVFCDTGWEHPITYEYIESINQTLLDGKLVTLKSDKYDGMRDLVAKKGRVPSTRARFCTEELKVVPMREYVVAQDDEVTVYQGIRASESPSRSQMKQTEWSDYYDCTVTRPLFQWTEHQVFEYLKEHNVEPNPLYKSGAGRVGCFPCVLVNHRELYAYMQTHPEVKERVKELEDLSGRSFFTPNYIPSDRQRGVDDKTGKRYPKADDVFKYIEDDPDQLELLPIVNNSCMSIYNLCE